VKTQVLQAIGETELQRAAGVNAALAANDRVKYLFTLLQMAATQAERPAHPPATLKRERLASGVADAELDEVIAGARRQGGQVQIPFCRRLLAMIGQEVQAMAAPVLAAHPEQNFADRLKAQLAGLPAAADDLLEPDDIDRITRVGGKGTDSLHQLVMDLHKALNAMQIELARETLDGASVYQLADAHRPLVAAFMAGVNRTAALKFDHPGLATTATSTADKLVLQNDIGTTDAHVIVLHVQGALVQLTYTDVHLERLLFLQDMLSPYQVVWSREAASQVAGLADGATFYMAVGRLETKDEAGRLDYLRFLGSRLVFLIDWNRARKQLRGFLPGPQRLAALRWAAEEEVGHRGFLELGGARLINQAIEVTAGSAMHFGDRLCDVLGAEATFAFVCFVLRAASEGLRERQSQALIRDRVRADLQTHFSNEDKRLLRLAADHAGLIFEIATLVRDGIAAADDDASGLGKLARRARRFEHDADMLVVATREAVARRPDHAVLLQLVTAADDAADQLEEVAFLLELLAESKVKGKPLEALGLLSDLLVEGAQEWIKALGHAMVVDRSEHGEAAVAHEVADDFLVAVAQVSELEHRADDAERALTYATVQHATDFRQLHLYAEIGRSLEEAADALKRASLITREYVLGNLLSR
jgi:uncharacterized protein Yka (UPF0111/DUF47 family)